MPARQGAFTLAWEFVRSIVTRNSQGASVGAWTLPVRRTRPLGPTISEPNGPLLQKGNAEGSALRWKSGQYVLKTEQGPIAPGRLSGALFPECTT
jgi:hypothetical protein